MYALFKKSSILVIVALALAGCDFGAPATQPTPGPQATTAAQSNPTSGSSAATSCEPTREDGEGPYYKPGAPERSSVGIGHLLSGVVRSFNGCLPIAGARIEFWQVGPNAQYDDDHRATVFSDASGAYSFESNFPPGYEGRPPHIHVRVTAEGHKLLITQYYPQEGEEAGTFDLVLVPSEE